MYLILNRQNRLLKTINCTHRLKQRESYIGELEVDEAVHTQEAHSVLVHGDAQTLVIGAQVPDITISKTRLVHGAGINHCTSNICTFTTQDK